MCSAVEPAPLSALFADQSGIPVAYNGTPSCAKVSLARPLSLMLVRVRLSGWLEQRPHVGGAGVCRQLGCGVDRGHVTRERRAGAALAGLDRGNAGVLVWAVLRASTGWQRELREALSGRRCQTVSVMLACAAGRSVVALHRLS
jgi:hypothetical protein